MRQQERYAEAEPLFQTVLQIRTKYNNTDGRRFTAMSSIGECLFKQKKDLERAESLLKNGYNELVQRSNQLPDHIRLKIVGGALQRLVEFYEGTDKPAQADTHRQKLAELEQAEGQRLVGKDYVSVF